MALDELISKESLKKEKNTFISLFTFLGTSFMDMTSTLYCSSNIGTLLEGNDLLKLWINYLDNPELGIAIPKLLTAFTVGSASYFVEYKRKNQPNCVNKMSIYRRKLNENIRGYHLLYAGSLIFTMATASWLYLDLFLNS